MGSPSGYITKEELVHWAKNALFFSLPAIILFLTALQNGSNLQMAWGAAYSAIVSALLGLAKSYLTDSTNSSPSQ